MFGLIVRVRAVCRISVEASIHYDQGLLQSAPEKHNQGKTKNNKNNNKKSTYLCAPREFLKQICRPCLIIIQSCYFDLRINKHMFSLLDLRFALFSRDLGVLRAQRIIGFFMTCCVYDKDHISALRIKNTVESDPCSYEVT